MLGLFDRLLLSSSRRAIATRPTPSGSHSDPVGDSFIVDWSLDGTDATDADDDTAIELTTSMK